MRIKDIVARIVGNDISVEIEKDMLMIRGRKRYTVLKYLISEEADYGLRDLDPNTLYRIAEAYITLYSKLPPGTELKIVKYNIDRRKLARRIENEMVNLKVMMDSAKEPHRVKKYEARLKILERLYNKILSGRDLERILLIVKVRASGRNIEVARETLDTLVEMVISFFKLNLGIKLRVAKCRELEDIIRYELGIVGKPQVKPIVVEAQKLAALQPIPASKRPNIERSEGIFLGYDMETGWPVVLDEKVLRKHILLVGPTGRGKTVTLATMMESIVALGLADVIAVDFKGDLAKIVDKGLVKKAGPDEYPLNITIKPDYIPVVDWALAINDLLLKIMKLDTRKCSEIIGVLAETRFSRELSPEDILLTKELAALANVIELATAKPSYTQLHDAIARENILFDLSGYGTTFQNMYGGLLLSIVSYLVSAGEIGDKAIVIDEAWRVLGLKPARTLVKEGRSRGVGLVIATQNVEDVPQDILDNIHTVIAFGSYSDNYVEKLSTLLGLRRSYMEKIKKLSTGEAVLISSIDPHPLFIRIEPPALLETKLKARQQISYTA